MKISKIKEIFNIVKEVTSKNPKLTKIVICGIVIILLSLSFTGTFNLGCRECNVSYDPLEVEEVKDIIKK
jgi:hypothetical protein